MRITRLIPRPIYLPLLATLFFIVQSYLTVRFWPDIWDMCDTALRLQALSHEIARCFDRTVKPVPLIGFWAVAFSLPILVMTSIICHLRDVSGDRTSTQAGRFVRWFRKHAWAPALFIAASYVICSVTVWLLNFEGSEGTNYPLRFSFFAAILASVTHLQYRLDVTSELLPATTDSVYSIEALRAAHQKYLHFLSYFWTVLIAIVFGAYVGLFTGESILIKLWGVRATAQLLSMYGIEAALGGVVIIIVALWRAYYRVEDIERVMRSIAQKTNKGS